MARMKKRLEQIFAFGISFGLGLAGGSPACSASGEELFTKHCALCHGKDGKAQSPAARKLGVKDLSISKLADAEIEKQLKEGKKDDHGHQKMPPFKDKFSADEIKSLIVVVKSFRK